MSLFDLKSLVSVEDFADSHEPLNDGIKEVPNAQTQAAEIKAGSVDKESESQKEVDITSEKTSEEDSTTDSDERSDAEPLEHDSEKDAKSDLNKTEKATTALEAYATKAKKFDIIGHPTRQRERIEPMVKYLNLKSGIKGEVTISAESVSNALDLGRKRIAKLEREIRILGAQKVANEQANVLEEIAVVEPTEHGAQPMDPVSAAALTEEELDPLDVPMLEIEKVQETINTLTQSGAAIEQYIKIIRANPRMSKQAAAVLQAGLEHIDQVCELKVRSTGMESYQATPRAAMEEADFDEKSLSARASEIGAKIIKFLMELITKAKTTWQKYRTGVSKIQQGIVDVRNDFKRLKGTPTEKRLDVSATVNIYSFIDGDFIGVNLSSNEEEIISIINTQLKSAKQSIFRPLLNILKSGKVDDDTVERIKDLETNNSRNGKDIALPAGYIFKEGVFNYQLVKDTPETSFNVPVIEIDGPELKMAMDKVYKFTEQLNHPDTIDLYVSISSSIISALTELRNRAKRGMFNEEIFQSIQSLTMGLVKTYLNIESYFEVMHLLGKIQAERTRNYRTLIMTWNSDYTTDE